jgi:hypothetical protein
MKGRYKLASKVTVSGVAGAAGALVAASRRRFPPHQRRRRACWCVHGVGSGMCRPWCGQAQHSQQQEQQVPDNRCSHSCLRVQIRSWRCVSALPPLDNANVSPLQGQCCHKWLQYGFTTRACRR